MNFQTDETIKIKDTSWTIRSIIKTSDRTEARYGWTHSIYMQKPKGAVYFSTWYNANTDTHTEPQRIGRLTRNEC